MRPCFEKILHKKRAGGVTQGAGSEFKPQYCKKKKERKRKKKNQEQMLLSTSGL
jgi:hypothetical protein